MMPVPNFIVTFDQKDICVVLPKWIVSPVVKVILLGNAEVVLVNDKAIEPINSKDMNSVETMLRLRFFSNFPFSSPNIPL